MQKIKRLLIIPVLTMMVFSFTVLTLVPLATQIAHAAPAATPAPTPAPTTNTVEDYDSNCRASLSPFGWVMCPLIQVADMAYGGFLALVNKLLFYGSGNYNTPAVKEIWRSFVVIANSVLVLLALVMIVSQIFSFEFFSAYSVKKILPRLIIGAIMVQLSWVLCTLLIDITNAVGAGIYWLILSPFSKFDNGGTLITLRDIFRFYSGDTSGAAEMALSSVGALGMLVGVAGVAYAALLPGVAIAIGLFAVGVVVGVVIAIFTLIVRQSLLVVLLAMAPLGIAFWILPGTNKLWNLWWGSFSKLLMMYPLIMILFASGTVAATIMAGTGDGMGDLLAVISFYAPVFLIGATFKFAGTAMGAVAGYVAGTGKKIGDTGFGLRKKKEIYDKARTDMKAREMADKQLQFANKAFAGDNRFQKARARAIVGGAALIPGWKRGESKLDSARKRYESIADEEEMKKAGEIWMGQTKTMQKDDRKKLQTAVANLKEGQQLMGEDGKAYKYIDAAGKEQTVELEGSKYLTRQALSSAVTDGNTGAFAALLDDVNGSKFSDEERQRREAIHSESMTKDGNYAALDILDPSLSRSKAGKRRGVMTEGDDDEELRDLFVKNIDTLKGDWIDSNGDIVKTKPGVEGIQKRIGDSVGSSIFSPTGNNPNEIASSRRRGVDNLDTFLRGTHTDTLYDEITETVLEKSGMTDAQKVSSREAMRLVRKGAGSSMIDYDPTTGTLIAKTTTVSTGTPPNTP